jgi:hypothetical protein
MLTYRGKVGSNLNFTVNGNLSHNNNRVVKLNDNPNEIRLRKFGGGKFQYRYSSRKACRRFLRLCCRRHFQFKGRRCKLAEVQPNVAGVDVYSMPGVLKFRDVNGDGKITPLDRTFLGDGYPNLSYGLNISLDYKNWDMTVFMQGLQGRKIINSISRGMLFIRSDGNT